MEDALKLDVSERAELVAELLASLDAEVDEDAEVAWAAEIERRMSDFRAGNVKTIPWSEVRARLHRNDR